MSLWILIPLVVYALGVVGLIIAIYREAPRHSADVGLLHYVIAAIWPAWLVWYVCLVVGDWFRRK